MALCAFGSIRIAAFCTDDPDEQHEEDLGLGLELRRELFQQQEDNSSATQREREVWSVGERLMYERAQVVLQ